VKPRFAAYPHVAAAHGYALDVVSGKVPACKYVKLAGLRFLDDLERAADFPYKFDPEIGERNCAFAECFRHQKGKWRGAPYRLEPWQCFRRVNVFGWVRKEPTTLPSGRVLYVRRFREAYLEVPRKNGKSLEEAIDGLYCFAADGEEGAECYSGATTEVQAWEVFRPARMMTLDSKDFRDAFDVDEPGAKLLFRTSDGSRFLPLIGKPGDGASPSWACADEYHEHETDDFADTMKTGMLAREQPLLEYATTAGENIEGPCYAMRERVIKMLEGTVPDDELWGVIYTIDAEPYTFRGAKYPAVDWTTVDALRMANPNYGVSVNPEILRADHLKAIADARKQGVFKTKHLGIWVGARSAWMNMEEWKRCGNAALTLESCIALGLPCWVGMDMAAKIAFGSVMFLFVDERGGVKKYKLVSRHYLPSETASDPTKQHYLKWVDAKAIIATEGGEIDFTRVEDETAEAMKAIRTVQELDFDPRHGTQVSQRIERLTGLPRIEMPQNVDTFSPAMYEIEAAVKSGRFEHDDNPVTNWMYSNVVAKPDARQALYPRSSRPGVNHTDGAVATMFGVRRALEHVPSVPAPMVHHKLPRNRGGGSRPILNAFQ